MFGIGPKYKFNKHRIHRHKTKHILSDRLLPYLIFLLSNPALLHIFRPALFPFIGPAAVCQICGARYSQRSYLLQHMKKHNGQTRCSICHKEFEAMRPLRWHMVSKHGVPQKEVDRMTNKRHQTPRNYWTRMYPAHPPGVRSETATSTTAVRASSAGSPVSRETSHATTVGVLRSDAG